MSHKRRFGVSIKREVSDKLDELCKLLGVDRSRLVELALARYLTELEHYTRSHECVSLVVASCRREASMVRNIVHKYPGRVLVDVHNHNNELCTIILLIEGNSRDLISMYRDASELEDCKVSIISMHD